MVQDRRDFWFAGQFQPAFSLSRTDTSRCEETGEDRCPFRIFSWKVAQWTSTKPTKTVSAGCILQLIRERQFFKIPQQIFVTFRPDRPAPAGVFMQGPSQLEPMKKFRAPKAQLRGYFEAPLLD